MSEEESVQAIQDASSLLNNTNEISQSDMSTTEDEKGNKLVTIGAQTQGTVSDVPDIKQWKWSEKVEGQGERPEYLDSKYDSVESQAKANNDAQKYIGELKQRLGAFGDGAPPEYNFEAIEDEKFKFDKTNPAYLGFTDFLAQNNIPQPIANKMVEFYKAETMRTHVDVEEEKKKIGPNVEAELVSLENWVKASYSKDVAPWLMKKMVTAQDISNLKQMRSEQVQSNIPTGYNIVPQMSTKEQILDDIKTNMYGGNKIANNPDLQEKLLKQLREIS